MNHQRAARDWHVNVIFTTCTVNMVLDSMAILERNVHLGLRIYDVPPKIIEMEILQNSVGVKYHSCYD
ncbi:hypothetical protein Godav_014327 [Gossypium davidsonii]|uniref:Uncharacterized protein n=1 Tax=Gossypium davidsonii TaxID=34287 RepID=A0A7J8RKX2_GOSDV|nr:hypothetical protein [Gossypium davidsonii]